MGFRPGNPAASAAAGVLAAAAAAAACAAAAPCSEGDISADRYGLDPCGIVGGARLEEESDERLEKVVSVERPGMDEEGGAPPRYPALYKAAKLAAAADELAAVDLCWPWLWLGLLLVNWAGECQGEVTRGPGLWLELGLARGRAGLG